MSFKIMTLALVMAATTVATSSAFAQQQSGRSHGQEQRHAEIRRARVETLEERFEERDQDEEISQEQQAPRKMNTEKTGWRQRAATDRAVIKDYDRCSEQNMRNMPQVGATSEELDAFMDNMQQCRAAARAGRWNQ